MRVPDISSTIFAAPSPLPTNHVRRLQSRDRHGRRVLPAAHKEKEAKDVWQNDPLQVCFYSLHPPPTS